MPMATSRLCAGLTVKHKPCNRFVSQNVRQMTARAAPFTPVPASMSLGFWQRSSGREVPMRCKTSRRPRCRGMVTTSAMGGVTFIEGYEAAVSTSPLLTKSLTSLLGFVIADVVAQILSKSKDESPFALDLARLGRTGLFGFVFYGPVSGTWYSWLDQTVLPDQPTSAAAVALKTLADQVLWAPCLVTSFFAWDLVWSEEAGLEQLPVKMQQDLLATLLVNWTFWPAFHLLNFRFVPPGDRILYINVVQAAKRAESVGGPTSKDV